MGQNHVAEDFGEFTLEEERETGVNEDYHELCELQPGQVSEIEILLHWFIGLLVYLHDQTGYTTNNYLVSCRISS